MTSITKLLVIIALVSTCLTTAPLCLASNVIEMSTGNRLYLDEHAEFLIDNAPSDDELIIVEQLLNQDKYWRNFSTDFQFNLFKYDVIWKKTSIKNTSNNTLELFIIDGEPGSAGNKAIILKNEKVTESWDFGTDRPFAERPISHRQFLIPVTLTANETITILWKAYGNGVGNSLWVEEQTQFWQKDSSVLFSDGMYYGAICIICLLILFLFALNRNISAIYFYIMLMGNALYHLSRSGYAFQYLWPETTDITSTVLLITVNFSTLGGVLFSSRFLELKHNNNILWQLSNAYLTFNIGIIVLALFGPASYSVPIIIFNVLFTIVYFSILIAYTFILSLKGDVRAKFYTVAWMLFLLPYVFSSIFWLYSSSEEIPILLKSRNGEVLLAIALYVALLYEVRRAQVDKQAALLEAKAKTNFVATMSHELRTPLNGVIGMAELLHETDQTPTQKQYSDIIISSGNVLLTLINDILDLTKITDGKLTLENRSFDLDSIISECSSTFLPLMIKKTLPLYASIDPDIPLILIGDEHRIRQIIFNLLSNALKFTEQGHVSLSVTAQAGNTPNWVNLTIAVEDSGIGISPQALTTIFNQFSQADTSTTRRFGGSGLGLAITKSIIEKMGGKITATSEEGKGSVFTVNLSLEVDNEKEQKRQQSLKLLSGIKLLAHTDFAGSFKAITPHILHWGMNIDICEDEEHALELLKNGQYDGLITIHMGQPWQVLKRLKECQLPILMMHYGPLEKQAIEWDNLVVSMPLPISIQKLADSINRLFDGNAPVTEVNKLDSAVNVSSDTSILVVEDNPTNQLVVKGMLKRLGVNADLAENGEQAVLMSLRKHYQIILMDCEMPIMDGFEASEKILAVETDSKPIIIALTAHAMDETRQHCLDSGMSHVLHKPITLAKLQDCLNKSGLSSIGKPD